MDPPLAPAGQPNNCWQDEADRRPCGAGGLGPPVDESAPEESVVAEAVAAVAAEESVVAAEAAVAAEESVASAKAAVAAEESVASAKAAVAAEESVTSAEAAVASAEESVVAAEAAVVAAEAAVGCDPARAERCAAERTGNLEACGRCRRGGGLRLRDGAEQHRSGQRAGTHRTGGCTPD